MPEKTYEVDALLAIFRDRVMAAQEDAHTWHIDSPCALVRYLIDGDGMWLSFADGLEESEIRDLTGYEVSELKKLGRTQSGQGIWGRSDESPLLPFPFTLPHLRQFEVRSSGMCFEQIWCGTETEDLIVGLARANPDAAEIATALAFPERPVPNSAPAAPVGPLEPLPLTSSEMAYCFQGLHSWDERKWKDHLGNANKWLAACIVTSGQRGRREGTWNPVEIGAALVRRYDVNVNSVRARFQTRPLLKPWLETWKTYEADYFDKN